jgi:alkyl sulfatase BDS1-like metallo-beta-lactamase superfamily hydrolase
MRRATLMVRLALLNCLRTRWTAYFIAITTVVHPAQAQQTKPAEPKVASANQAVQSQLPFSDRQDFEDAMRGFIATTPDPANWYRETRLAEGVWFVAWVHGAAARLNTEVPELKRLPRL